MVILKLVKNCEIISEKSFQDEEFEKVCKKADEWRNQDNKNNDFSIKFEEK